MKRVIIIVVALLLVGLIGFRLANNKKEIAAKNQVKDTSNVRVMVNVTPVQSRVSERNLRLVGTVTADQVIEVKSEVQGKILNLNVDLGDKVRKGQVLARVDDQIRQLAVANAQQVLADARQNLQRYQNLYEGGAASKAQYDQYSLAYKNAQNQLAQARKEVSNAVIVAPISGQITQKAVETGAFASIGTTIATIVDVSKLKVQLTVPESDVYVLKEGDPVTISSTVYPGVNFTGRITFISPRGDEAHNYPVEVSLTNQSENPLRAGTYVDVAFNRKNQTSTLQIPREALVGSIKDAQVYVVGADNVAQLRKITIGTDNGAYLEVLEGLREGENVVTTGQINLDDSTKVSIIAAR